MNIYNNIRSDMLSEFVDAPPKKLNMNLKFMSSILGLSAISITSIIMNTYNYRIFPQGIWGSLAGMATGFSLSMIYIKATDEIIKRFIESRRASDEENRMRIAEKVKTDNLQREHKHSAVQREELVKELCSIKSKLKTLRGSLDTLKTSGTREEEESCVSEIRSYETRINHLTREITLLDKKLSKK